MIGAMTSNREKKRIVQAGVRRVIATTGWDPASFRPRDDQSATGRAATEIRQALTAAVYGDTGTCPDCARARSELNDQTALCERHMKEALGM